MAFQWQEIPNLAAFVSEDEHNILMKNMFPKVVLKCNEVILKPRRTHARKTLEDPWRLTAQDSPHGDQFVLSTVEVAQLAERHSHICHHHEVKAICFAHSHEAMYC